MQANTPSKIQLS